MGLKQISKCKQQICIYSVIILYDSVLLNMKTSKGENTFNKYLNTETSNLCIFWWFVIYVETSPVASEL